MRIRIRRAFPYLIVAAGGFLIAYVITFLFAFPSDVLPDEGILPNVIGLPYEDAARTLEKSGFVALQGERRMHNTAPEGTVLEQDPPAESRQKRGVEVRLAVSAGPVPTGNNTPLLPGDTVTNQGPVVPENPEGIIDPYIPPPPPPSGTFRIDTTPTQPPPSSSTPPRWPSPSRPTPVPNIPPPPPPPPSPPSPPPTDS